MKTSFQVILPAVFAIIAGTALAEEQPVKPVTAEVWDFEIPAGVSAKAAFEKWRAQPAPAEPRILQIDGLSIPARESATMVRVAGVLNAPFTGYYAFGIHTPDLKGFDLPDKTELWIHDGRTDEWKLAQGTGNPVKSGGRTLLEAGTPRRFELWTAGRNRVVVDWKVTEFGVIDPATGKATEKLARQLVPASALGLLNHAPGEKKTDAMGPNSPWGDPDGDGLLNWQEQAANTDPRKADVEDRAGLVRWEIWRDIPGRYVFDLRRAGHFSSGPHEVRYLDRLEIPTGNGDNYGSRVRGWLVAPADGEYRIGIRADDAAELWLGENESWQSKRLAAKADLYVSAHVPWFRRNDEGRKVPNDCAQICRVTLKAGSRYYFEILQKQGTSSDHCAVLWIKPGAEKHELIDSRHIVSWKPCPTDTDDDGLPDEWQRSVGLADSKMQAALCQAEADPDLDGATNREEWLGGTNPLSKADSPSAAHMLTSETWTGVTGRSVSNLIGEAHYPDKPTLATRIDNLDFGHEGENYGVRLRGYLTPPADGNYQFSISGNNACNLYLADSEDKFAKRIISRVEVGTRWRSFDLSGEAQSDPIPLEGGKRYYIEVIYKRGETESEQDLKHARGATGDHSSVAWKLPGKRGYTVIPPGVFSLYKPDPRDFDDDDLPDDWERTHHLDSAISGGSNGSWGDPDGDGLENFREFQLGLNPQRNDVHGTPGLALWEMWDNRGDILPALREHGGHISDLIKRDERFPLEPTYIDWRDALESPRRQGKNFGARLRAQIVAPASGEYTFSIAVRDVGELFLSTDDSKFKRIRIASVQHGTAFRSWESRPGQMSEPIRLEAGRSYYIEALHARGPFHYNDDFLSIAWKPPGSDKFEVIGAEHLVAFHRDPNDNDDDDLPDDWERQNGLPVNGSSTNGDFDRDGLTNREEYLLGTRADLADTDGDGVSDADELRVYGSDPLVKDAVPPKLKDDFVLDNAISPAGTWLVNSDGVMTSTAMRGSATFQFTVDKPGLHVVRLDARVIGSNGYTPAIPVSALVDGVEIGRGLVTTAEGGLSWVTHWLSAGPHELTIQNRNTKFNIYLEITSLKLFRMVGEDGADDGMPAWYAKIISAANSFTLTGVEDLEIQVSPACIEGNARAQRTMNLEVDGSPCEVYPGIGTGWYANVPLAEKNRTVVVGRFEGDTITKHLNLVWVAVNPFQSAGHLKVRVGDAMKFTVPASSATDEQSDFALSLDGKQIYTGKPGTEVVVRFERSGDHILEVSSSGADGAKSRRITITAMKADFGPTFSIAAGVPRKWKLPDVSPLLTLESDPLLKLDNITPLAPAGLRATAMWKESSAAEPRVLARLSEGGPILAATSLNVFKLVDAAVSGDAHVVDILPDGTRVVEISYIIEGRIPEDFSMWIDFAVTDAVFADGSTRYLLTAADFDESGIARIKIYKAPGTGVAFVCHWNRLFENDKDADTAPETETEAGE